jgi:hypothetical protein
LKQQRLCTHTHDPFPFLFSLFVFFFTMSGKKKKTNTTEKRKRTQEVGPFVMALESQSTTPNEKEEATPSTGPSFGTRRQNQARARVRPTEGQKGKEEIEQTVNEENEEEEEDEEEEEEEETDEEFEPVTMTEEPQYTNKKNNEEQKDKKKSGRILFFEDDSEGESTNNETGSQNTTVLPTGEDSPRPEEEATARQQSIGTPNAPGGSDRNDESILSDPEALFRETKRMLGESFPESLDELTRGMLMILNLLGLGPMTVPEEGSPVLSGGCSTPQPNSPVPKESICFPNSKWQLYVNDDVGKLIRLGLDLVPEPDERDVETIGRLHEAEDHALIITGVCRKPLASCSLDSFLRYMQDTAIKCGLWQDSPPYPRGICFLVGSSLSKYHSYLQEKSSGDVDSESIELPPAPDSDHSNAQGVIKLPPGGKYKVHAHDILLPKVETSDFGKYIALRVKDKAPNAPLPDLLGTLTSELKLSQFLPGGPNCLNQGVSCPSRLIPFFGTLFAHGA